VLFCRTKNEEQEGPKQRARKIHTTMTSKIEEIKVQIAVLIFDHTLAN
jgi:hypothetical protein